MMHTVHRIVQKLVTTLKTQYSLEEAQSIAWELFRHVTQKSRIQLLMEKEGVPDEQIEMLMQLVQKHLNEQVPIAYLTGEIVFGDLMLMIKPPILIPRSETESWCYELIERLEQFQNEPLRILDLCTGSGCIALALAHALPQAHITGIDIDPRAIALAEENRKKLDIKNCTFIESNLFEQLHGETFDLIVSNPPYIGEKELPSLAPSVRNFESPQALFAEDDGCAIINKIITQAPRHLHHNDKVAVNQVPQLLIEIGYTQGETIKAFMQHHNYVTIQLWKDYQGHNRVVCARVSADDAQKNTKS